MNVKKKKKHEGGRLDVLHNLLRGHPEWKLSGPVCQSTSSFDGFVPGFEVKNKLNWIFFFCCCLASLSQVIQNNINYERWRFFLPVQLSAAAYLYRDSLESHPFFFLPPPSCRGQGWLPVILAGSVNVCCSISTSIKLFLSLLCRDRVNSP